MKRLLSQIVGAGCLAALLAAPVLAQEDARQPNRDLELAEDMEIMGRLLDEALEAVYRQPNGGLSVTSGGPVGTILMQNNKARTLFGVGADVTGEQSKRAASTDLVREPLAVSLEGQGIVFQTETPLPRQVEGHENGVLKRAGCPFLARSPWERMQLHVQSGNPSGAKETCQKCHDPASSRAHWFLSRSNGGSTARPTREQLVDALLQVLAENGHNVRHLKPEERITLALTFRRDENADTIPVHEKLGFLLSKEAANASQQAYVKLLTGQSIMQRNRDSQPLAGDLLLNTHQYDRAIVAYQKALEESGVKDLFQHTPDAGQRRIYRQLLQAHVGAGNLEEAQKLIAILRAGEVKTTPDEKSPPPLPARLVVSATKAQLDQVAGREMSREEFAKQAKVQFLEGRGGESSKSAKIDWTDLIDPEAGGILYDRRDSTPVPKSPRNR